jgi:tRNA G18 (ribose-2'-O)-methylase SpoU
MSIAKALPIEHLDDSRLSAYANLRHAEKSTEFFVAEGRLPVERLIASRYEVESLVVQQGREQEFATQLSPSTPIYSLPRTRLRELVGFDFHRGVLACGRRRPLQSIEQLDWAESELPLALAIIGVTELENVGSLLRSAAGFGIEHVLIGPQTADPFSRRVIRVSMANLFSLQLYRLDRPVEQLTQLQQRRQVRCVATSLDPRATPLPRFVHDARPMILIVGNEANGLDGDVLDSASDRVTIPMHPGIDSLNVAVAGAVFMYGVSHACVPRNRGTQS